MRVISFAIVILFVVGCGAEDTPSDNRVHDRCPGAQPNVAILLLDGTYNTELTAPYDVFYNSRYRCDNGFNVFTVSPDDYVIKTAEGLRVIPDYAFDDSIPQVDVFVIPATMTSMGADLENDSLLMFVTRMVNEADFVLSLCDGAFLLAETGFLDGVSATTFPTDQEALASRYPKVDVQSGYSFVRSGSIITSLGGVHAFDACYYLHEIYFGTDNTKATAEGMADTWEKENIDLLNY